MKKKNTKLFFLFFFLTRDPTKSLSLYGQGYMTKLFFIRREHFNNIGFLIILLVKLVKKIIIIKFLKNEFFCSSKNIFSLVLRSKINFLRNFFNFCSSKFKFCSSPSVQKKFCPILFAKQFCYFSMFFMKFYIK